MMIAIFFCIFLTEILVCRSDNIDGWAPSHGLTWGVLNEVQCPNGGVITGIRYRSNEFVERLGFYCTSSNGVTLIGPFGGDNDNTLVDDQCPQGMHVQSIYGRGAAALDAIGINCESDGGQKVRLQLHGGTSGSAADYDDSKFATNGKKPSGIKDLGYRRPNHRCSSSIFLNLKC